MPHRLAVAGVEGLDMRLVSLEEPGEVSVVETVQCTTHVDSDKIPTTDYVNPTEHVVKIAGATKETRIVIAAHPYGTKHYRLWIDDIQVTKDR